MERKKRENAISTDGQVGKYNTFLFARNRQLRNEQVTKQIHVSSFNCVILISRATISAV